MAFGTFLEGFCVSSAILYVAVNFPIQALRTRQVKAKQELTGQKHLHHWQSLYIANLVYRRKV